MPASENPRVFVVDDEPPILLLMDRILRAHQFDPQTFPDGSSALERMMIDKPALVLVDMHMPQMSGEEFIRRMRENRGSSSVPVLILSGERLGADDVRKMGAAGAIQKPFQLDTLIAQIRSLTDNA